MNKLSSTANTLDKIIAAIFWLAVIAGVLNFGACVWLVISFLLDPGMIRTATAGLTLDYLFFNIAPGYITSSDFGLYLNALQALSVALNAVLICMALRTFRRILQPMICRRPFDTEISAGLKKLGIISILLGVGNNLLGWISIAFVSSGYDLDRLFLSENITGVTVNYKLDLTFLLLAAVLFLLSYVFRYGQELQQLSDETL